MTRDEALTIIEMVLRTWPGGAMSDKQMEEFVDALLPLRAESATRAVAMAHKDNPNWRPSIANILSREHAARTPVATSQAQPSQALCGVCLDDGWVCIGANEVGTDQSAPCPSCERGKRLDGPHTRREWGPDGFWKGRLWKQTGKQTVELGAAGGAQPVQGDDYGPPPQWVKDYLPTMKTLKEE